MILKTIKLLLLFVILIFFAIKVIPYITTQFDYTNFFTEIHSSFPVLYNGNTILDSNHIKADLSTINNGVSILNPFIAIAAAIVTGLAFFVQYTANQQLKNDSAKQQEERQFYEMLKIHRENVEKFDIVSAGVGAQYSRIIPDSNGITKLRKIPAIQEYVHHHHKGQNAIRCMLHEFLFLYACFQSNEKIKNDSLQDQNFKKAYAVFFEGIERAFSAEDKSQDDYKNLKTVKDAIHSQNFNKLQKIEELSKFHQLEQSILFQGHRHILNAYYRNLFLIVKSVVKSNIFDKKEKEKYLKILRAQMPDEEQTLLFFNWKSGYGSAWEDKDNHFFTKWKMIHNIELKNFEYSEDGKLYKDENDLYKEFTNLKEADKKDLFEFVSRRNK
ncbi:MAG: putative phage abortive infection protein [Hallerella sp.]|uniref:putative phage abortive infection protein n=1 Tax=Hallerella sp. TaxID=2815812 RepID=UPI0025853D8C|nr:putative phage abortive infection protein [Hallerella sp.]MCI5601046.1 putative phage abortive infection protein [Hallerella sp.]